MAGTPEGESAIPILIFYNPANTSQQYQTISASDPNIPAGYLNSQGSDGAIPEALKVYTAGINSGGFPSYQGDPGQAANPQGWINGVLGGYVGGKATP